MIAPEHQQLWVKLVLNSCGYKTDWHSTGIMIFLEPTGEVLRPEASYCRLLPEQFRQSKIQTDKEEDHNKYTKNFNARGWQDGCPKLVTHVQSLGTHDGRRALTRDYPKVVSMCAGVCMDLHTYTPISLSHIPRK